MNTLYHLSLEKEIVQELNPVDPPTDGGTPPKMRRETVLAVVSRSAQLSPPFHELLSEASLLAASATEMEYFGYAELRGGRMLVGWGLVADSSRNVDPVPVAVTRDPASSGFAFALERDHPVVLFNAGMDERFQDAQMIGHRIRSGIICPIAFRDQQYGALGIFSPQPRTLTKSDVMFVQSLALVLGPTRAHQNAERALAEHSRFLSSAIDSLDALVVLLREDGTVAQVNRTCLNVSGYSAEQLRGQRLAGSLLSAHEDTRIEQELVALKREMEPLRRDATLVTRTGEQRRISWTFARLAGSNPDALFLGTGIDVTEQYRALEQLGRAEAQPAAKAAATSQEPDGPPQFTLAPTVAFDKSPSDVPADRRSHNRHPYSRIQSVAPCMNGQLPERGHFRAVRCHDISPKGFSFLLAAEPDFDELVAAFGSAQTRIFLRSRVVHSTRFRHDGRSVLLVGCEYIGRVRLPWVNPVAVEMPL
ncbi:MAG: PAS domain S-box protein [Pirellulaceae bacterium]